MPDASLPRNSFDRGFNIKYNFSAGLLLPTFAQFCVGGSKVKINQKSFIRSAAINTQAMTSVRYFTDFFCVPLRLIYSQFGQFKTKTNDIHSSAFSTVPSRLPVITPTVMGNVMNGAVNDGRDICGFDLVQGAARLAELLGYGWTGGYDRNHGDINALTAAAYQKIYFDHYRNTTYESNDPEAYNLDQFAISGTNISQAVAIKLLTQRYCNYRKDFYGNIYPSLNYISSGASGLQNTWDIPSSVVGAVSSGQYSVVNGSPSSEVLSVVTGSPSRTYMSVQSLRAAFALDKLVRASSYAPQHVKDQYAARYGFRPKGYSMDESHRLGSFMTDINFGEVTQMAATQDGSLGQIGGKGVGGSDWQDVISYECKDDCIIMGISYAMPRVAYDALMTDKFSQKFVATDFYQPEFMNLGLQPVLMKDFVGSQASATIANIILGYVPRYSEYKINVDKNFGEFKVGGALSAFTMHGRGTRGISGSAGLSASFFKCSPVDMDSIFVTAYDGDSINDQFFAFVEYAFGCVAPMSVHGIPSL